MVVSIGGLEVAGGQALPVLAFQFLLMELHPHCVKLVRAEVVAAREEPPLLNGQGLRRHWECRRSVGAEGLGRML